MVNTMDKKKFFAELVKENGDRILSWKKATDPHKTYVRPFDYSLSHGGMLTTTLMHTNMILL
ncbi:MAG: hypothetical protein J5767_12575 [Paludibacteraceae bacterium]|nr:hypothetical protein [Paludibacteraceae bacterium]